MEVLCENCNSTFVEVDAEKNAICEECKSNPKENRKCRRRVKYPDCPSTANSSCEGMNCYF